MSNKREQRETWLEKSGKANSMQDRSAETQKKQGGTSLPGKGKTQKSHASNCGQQETWTLGTWNLLKQPAMCAQRFPNTMVKIALHLDWENIWVTSGDTGEGPKPSKVKEREMKGQSSALERYAKKWGRIETGGTWVVKSFLMPKRRGTLKFSWSFKKYVTLQ